MSQIKQPEFDLKYSEIPTKEELIEAAEMLGMDVDEDNVFEKVSPSVRNEIWRMFRDDFRTDLKQSIDADKFDITGTNNRWSNVSGEVKETVTLDEVLEAIVGDSKDFNLYVDFYEDHIEVMKTDHDSPTLKQANKFNITGA